MSWRGQARTSAAMLVAAALVAAGCGSDGGGRDDGTRSSSSAPAESRDLTPPEPDEALTEELGDAATTLTEAGCTFGTHEEGEPEHVDAGDDLESAEYPPTSGRHYADWAPFGLYDEPLEDGYVVHNLEHGGVAVWLGTEVDDATTEAVSELLDQDEKWVVAPREDIDGIVSAAWGKSLHCPAEALEQLGPDEMADALDDWYEAVVSTGSEAEKDVPAYAGAMQEPSPKRDISTESPF